jgi:hypothetical protein
MEERVARVVRAARGGKARAVNMERPAGPAVEVATEDLGETVGRVVTVVI